MTAVVADGDVEAPPAPAPIDPSQPAVRKKRFQATLHETWQSLRVAEFGGEAREVPRYLCGECRALTIGLARSWWTDFEHAHSRTSKDSLTASLRDCSIALHVVSRVSTTFPRFTASTHVDRSASPLQRASADAVPHYLADCIPLTDASRSYSRSANCGCRSRTKAVFVAIYLCCAPRIRARFPPILFEENVVCRCREKGFRVPNAVFSRTNRGQ